MLGEPEAQALKWLTIALPRDYQTRSDGAKVPLGPRLIGNPVRDAGTAPATVSGE